MRITYKSDYSLKTILNLAIHYGEEPVTIHELAKRSDIPIKFLEQILLDLKRGGFVESRRGKVGGYLLAKHPSKIGLLEVVRFVAGPVEPIACVDKKYRRCRDIDKCVFRDIWQKITNATEKILEEVTFEDLVKKSRKSQGNFVYQI
ncbi:MAG: Rrf2 family transcriptional regulator [Candidatus Omnitrophica bacterium]|nr:Rrf2 family transcriptional regulator [Candidatus Omnitrophota bacterium]